MYVRMCAFGLSVTRGSYLRARAAYGPSLLDLVATWRSCHRLSKFKPARHEHACRTYIHHILTSSHIPYSDEPNAIIFIQVLALSHRAQVFF